MPHSCSACETTQAATDRLAERGARLTGLRRDVLHALHHQDRPIGAYDLFDLLQEQGKASAPPAVYRVLDFLVTSGLAHKVESLSAYTACQASSPQHAAVLLVCQECGHVDEDARPLESPLAGFDVARGFQTHAITVEALGLCAACQAHSG